MPKKRNKKTQQLPKEFKKYFWDVEFSKISLTKNLNLVLSRLMNFGNMRAIRWMLKSIKEATLKEYLNSFGDRQLDKRSNNFWRLYFGIKHA